MLESELIFRPPKSFFSGDAHGLQARPFLSFYFSGGLTSAGCLLNRHHLKLSLTTLFTVAALNTHMVPFHVPAAGVLYLLLGFCLSQLGM